MMQANGEEGQPELKCKGYLKRKIDTRDGKRSARRWDECVYWVRLQGTRMHFFMVESMYNHGENHPPPATTVEPPREHMHKLKEEPLDVTQYWVDNLHYKRHGKRCDNTFFLELRHECRVLGCPPRCKQDGRVMEKIVFQAPSEQRMKQWAVALQDVGRCVQRLLEDTLPRPSSSATSRDPLVVHQELEQIRQRLLECRQMDEHLSFMQAEIDRSRDVFQVFHYWDKTCGKMRLVDTTREHLEAVLLKDYLLYPGAEWSKLAQGTAVLVVGKAPVGNMYCVKTMRSVACTESNPAKWDSGFLSVAPVEGTNDNPDQANLEEAESGGGAGEVFAVEMGDSPMVQGRQRRMSMSCPSSPMLERREIPAIPEGEGPECPHEENALTIPLVGFVASSALDLFSSQEWPAVSVVVGSRAPYRVSWPSSLAWSRDAEESGWSIRDFCQLWRTGDTDSMEGMESDSDEVSLTPSSASSYSIVSSNALEPTLGCSPNDTAVSTTPRPKEASVLSRSAPAHGRTMFRKQPIRWSMGRKTHRATESKPQLVRVISNPPFGVERELRVEAGGEEELGYLLEGYDPEREAVQHVFVVKVEPGSPAYQAGLFRGDAICKVDDVDVRYRSVDGIQAEVAQARSVAKLEGRSKISLRVQWRNGSTILSKVRDLRECCSQLKQQQKMLHVLLDREMALLAGSLQGNGMAAWEEGQGADSGDGMVDDVISVVHAAVATLKADYFILPTVPFLLFTYSNGDAGQEAFIRGVHNVREAAGSGLRDELALILPPRKGTIVFTQPHQLKARGMCHLVMGSTYRPLELACLKALEHACGLQSKRLVFAGFMCDQVKVLMRTILLYSKPETPNIPKCVFASEAAEQAKDYMTCLELVSQQLHTTWDESYRGDMDRLVSQQARGMTSP